ncbi:MAG: winged helix-turn-helix domain-containing protein, partial [bacterium]|nr:winged helix-turn-helix domain-containing protein [bacterium]
MARRKTVDDISPITQNDLGLMADARRENVSRQLKKWIDQGVLSKIRKYYCIENIE